jgi:hypothetical protein
LVCNEKGATRIYPGRMGDCEAGRLGVMTRFK